MTASKQPHAARSRPVRAFTAVEMLMVLIIMSIIAVVGVDSIANFESAQRADRAARESMAFFRYARQLAISSGKKTQIRLDTANKTVGVYQETTAGSNTYAMVTNVMGTSGNMQLNLSTQRELAGTTLSVNPSTATTYTYNLLGSLDTAADIYFNFGSRRQTLKITKVGDPQLTY